MSQLPSIRRHVLVIALLALLLFAQTAHAAPQRVAVALPVLWAPVLWAKGSLIGYSLLFLGILLGLLAVLIPSMRKVLRKKE